MSALVRGREVRPLVGLGGAIVYSGHKQGQAELQIALFPFPLLIMSDSDDSAALWKVNRTIHELVKDRVQQRLP
jgi:hypothetical protein